MLTIPHKRGATFLMDAQLSVSGTTDYSTWALPVCEVRDGTALVAACAVTWVDHAAGSYRLRVDSTAAWPAKRLLADIRYTTPAAQVVYTDTFAIQVEANITQQ